MWFGAVIKQLVWHFQIVEGRCEQFTFNLLHVNWSWWLAMLCWEGTCPYSKLWKRIWTHLWQKDANLLPGNIFLSNCLSIWWFYTRSWGRRCISCLMNPLYFLYLWLASFDWHLWLWTLQQKSFTFQCSTEEVTLLWVFSILHLAYLPSRLLADNARDSGRYDFSYNDMGLVLDLMEDWLEEILEKIYSPCQLSK